MRHYRYLLCIAAASVAACASGKSGDTREARPPVPTQQTDTLTATDIAGADLPTAYDVVDKYRRNWLRRDRLTGAAVTVYMENQSVGNVDQLKQIPSNTIRQMNYLTHEKAVQRWGAGVAGSVIELVRK